jgi:hypothetical protein
MSLQSAVATLQPENLTWPRAQSPKAIFGQIETKQTDRPCQGPILLAAVSLRASRRKSMNSVPPVPRSSAASPDGLTI